VKIFVAEITVKVAGVDTTFYFATDGIATQATDTPANTYIPARLKSAGSFKRSLYSGSSIGGAIKPNFGELQLFNGDGGLDAWADYAVSGGKVVVRMGDKDGAYPADYDTVYVAYAQHLVADFSVVKVRLRDRLLLLDSPINKEGFDGSGGLEGTTATAGKLKQWVSESPNYVPVTQINSNLQLYFVQSTRPAVAGFLKVYEGGIEITRGTDYATENDCLTISPAPGECRFYFGVGGLGPVYVRLGSVPIFDIRAVVSGATQTGAAWTAANLADAGGIAGGTGTVAIGNLLVDDNRTYLDVISNACAAAMGWAGMTRLDAFVSGLLAAPAATALYTFTQHNTKNMTRAPVGDLDAAVYSLTVNGGKTWPGNVAAGVSPLLHDYLTRTPWWSSFNRTDDTVKTAHPGAIAKAVDIEAQQFKNAFQQDNYLDNYFELFGVPREFYTFKTPLDSETLALELHGTVAIKLPRFGLGAGKNFRIISQLIDCDERAIQYGVWG
jgi:hypothetical protein